MDKSLEAFDERVGSKAQKGWEALDKVDSTSMNDKTTTRNVNSTSRNDKTTSRNRLLDVRGTAK